MNMHKLIKKGIQETLLKIPEFQLEKQTDVLESISIEAPKNREFGDFATNAAMVLAKFLKKNPREVAAQIVPYIQMFSYVKDVAIAGPGFINLSIKDEFLQQTISLPIEKNAQKNEVIDLDYGGYNIGKNLHVGHLRTTVVGDTFNRIARFLGYTTKSYNHMGDWGRPMGLIISWILEYGMPSSVDDINAMYPESTARSKEDKEWLERAKRVTADLQSGNAEYQKIYDVFAPMSLGQVDKLLKRLNILLFDENKGERLVAEYVPVVQNILEQRGLLVFSDGAYIIPVKQDTDSEPMPPVMWRSSAGAQTYAAADLTAIYYREKTDAPKSIIYFTDNRQNLHFRQIFRAARLAGLAKDIRLEHVGFGTITGPDGKPFKTRDGGVPSLDNMLDFVKESVNKRVADSGKSLSDAAIEMIALAALKFNDLMHDVKTDYVFDADSVTSFEGRTGPYILYTAVRLRSILNKAGVLNTELDSRMYGTVPLNSEERNLLLILLNFERTLEVAFERRATYLIANYAYDLCQAVNTFYHNCPILRTDIDDATRIHRLCLVNKTFVVLSILIDLMGLQTPDEM